MTSTYVERMSKILMMSFVFQLDYDVCGENCYVSIWRQNEFFKCVWEWEQNIFQLIVEPSYGRYKASEYHYELGYKMSLRLHTGMYWLLNFDWLLAVILLSKTMELKDLHANVTKCEHIQLQNFNYSGYWDALMSQFQHPIWIKCHKICHALKKGNSNWECQSLWSLKVIMQYSLVHSYFLHWCFSLGDAILQRNHNGLG